MKTFIFEIIIGIRWDRTNVLRIFIKKESTSFFSFNMKRARCHHSCPYNKKKTWKTENQWLFLTPSEDWGFRENHILKPTEIDLSCESQWDLLIGGRSC